jgi:hypothetical protein
MTSRYEEHMTFPRAYAGAPSPMLPASSTSPIALAATDPGTPPVRGLPAAPASLADDLLQGAEAIALFMFGSITAKRQVYRLSSEVPRGHRPPFFKLGSNCLCARRSAILRWVEEQEAAHNC